MKKGKRSNVVFRILIFLIFGLMPPIFTSFTVSYNEPEPEGPYPSVFPLETNDKIWVEETLSKMNISEKCAQMIMPWLNAVELENDDIERKEKIENLVTTFKVGGFILFQGDVESEIKLIKQLQNKAEIPLLFASDFERGPGNRLKDGLEFPYSMAVAATGEEKLAYDMGKVIAFESKSIGINQNFAPVADINNNADNPIINIRSFSEDKLIVSRFVTAFVNGANSERFISTVKHFPGHGNTIVDSHTDLPLININFLNLTNNELIPFLHAIQAGVQSVMVGHLVVPSIDKDRIPASLSKSIIRGFLIKELGFDGLIVTDALNMSAITKYYSVAEAVRMAVEAGNDILLMPPDEEVALNSLVDAVKSGKISEERIDESVRKILSAKRWSGSGKSGKEKINKILESTSIKSHKRLSKNIAEKSITLVKNEKDLIPVDLSKYKKISVISVTDSYGSETEELFQNLVKDKTENVQTYFITRKSKLWHFNKALQIAKKSDLVILPAFIRIRENSGTVDLSKHQKDFITKVLKLNTPVILISFGNPYLLSAFPDSYTYLTSYGYVQESQFAMLNAITGNSDIQGRLPISIPETDFETGHGIKIKKNTLTFPEEETDSNYNFEEVNEMMKSGLNEKVFPGGVLLVAQNNKVVYNKSFGNFTFNRNSEPVKKETIYDISSITNIIALTTSIMILADEGKLDINDYVYYFLPEFRSAENDKIIIRNLLKQNSGLPAVKDLYKKVNDSTSIKDILYNTQLSYKTGSKTINSELNLIALQLIIEKVTNKNLDAFLKEKITTKLELENILFNPGVEVVDKIAPSNKEIKLDNKIEPFDKTANLFNGVSGVAGLFSSAKDLAVFSQMILQKGKYGSQQIISQNIFNDWFNDNESKLIGWNKPTDIFSEFSNLTMGQNGNSGTSLWIDKNRDLIIVLLTNSSYSGESKTKLNNFRHKLFNIILSSVDYY